MKSKQSILNITGESVRRVEIEAIQSFYTLTKLATHETTKELTGPDLDWLLSKKPEDFTFDTMVGMFGKLADETDRKSKGIPFFNIWDTITVPATKSFTKEEVKTTVGRYVFNMVLVEGTGLAKVFGYINEIVTDDYYNTMESMISTALLDDVIDIDTMIRWIDRRDWFGFSLHGVITTSFSPSIIKTPPEVKALKKELEKKYAKEIKEGDPKAGEAMEKVLVKKTMEVFKDDYGMDLYASGARGSVKNNLKNTNMMRGAIKNPATGKYDIVMSSLMDGMQIKDIPASSNSIVGGSYPNQKLWGSKIL